MTYILLGLDFCVYIIYYPGFFWVPCLWVSAYSSLRRLVTDFKSAVLSDTGFSVHILASVARLYLECAFFWEILDGAGRLCLGLCSLVARPPAFASIYILWIAGCCDVLYVMEALDPWGSTR